MILCRLLSFFKIIFSQNSFRNTISVSNSLDRDQDRRSVGPGLGPNCLQRLSADDKPQLARKDLMVGFSSSHTRNLEN